MRYRNHSCLLKIAVIFVATLLFFSLWYITGNNNNSYQEKFTEAMLSEFTANIESPKLHIRQNGEYWILENFVVAKKQFGYLESMTYTTQGEFVYLDNLQVIVERWRSPVSIAVFAPGTDFDRTLRSIDYLQSCTTQKDLIRDMVTFHIFFPAKHMPLLIPKTRKDFIKFTANCSKAPPYVTEASENYRHKNSILYPINIGRNIAREMAKTHYIFPSDIEMYPNFNFVQDFLGMIHRDPDLLMAERLVYPLAVFEVGVHESIPNTKTDLQMMIHNGSAIPFHKNICMPCHAIPELNRWLETRETESLDIFLMATHQASWEPFYITTNSEPLFDERFTWEGKYDKRIQADLLGMMNYTFAILNNAFLTHRPGIKAHTEKSNPEIGRMQLLMRQEINPQLEKLYG